MRRSTKITIGVIVFILIGLIVGITLYFVLRKKPSSSSPPSPPAPPGPPSPPSDNSRQELLNLLQSLNKTNEDFINEKANIDKYFYQNVVTELNPTLKKQMIEKLVSTYQTLWTSIGSFVATSNSKILTLIAHDDTFSQKNRDDYSERNQKVNQDINSYQQIFIASQKSGDVAQLLIDMMTYTDYLINDIIKMLYFYR
jgi:hypothetical protein